MTIDGRLEALTRSVESSAQVQPKKEKENRKLGRCVRAIVLDRETPRLALAGDEKDED
jgi:hypothetical protein